LVCFRDSLYVPWGHRGRDLVCAQQAYLDPDRAAVARPRHPGHARVNKAYHRHPWGLIDEDYLPDRVWLDDRPLHSVEQAWQDENPSIQIAAEIFSLSTGLS
jgi:hypothetical protein